MRRGLINTTVGKSKVQAKTLSFLFTPALLWKRKLKKGGFPAWTPWSRTCWLQPNSLLWCECTYPTDHRWVLLLFQQAVYNILALYSDSTVFFNAWKTGMGLGTRLLYLWGRAHAHQPTLSRQRAPVISDTITSRDTLQLYNKGPKPQFCK